MTNRETAFFLLGITLGAMAILTGMGFAGLVNG